jgi:hypothetical protein
MKYLCAAVVALALGGTANAQLSMRGSPTDGYERGWDQGYEALNPGQRGPVFYSRPYLRDPLDSRSDFQRGIADGAERGREDSGE